MEAHEHDTATSAIALRGVTKRFGAVVAVDDVSLAIGAGEFFSLLGPSGSGKTTVLRMIAGFERPTQGSIDLAGADVTDSPPFDRDVNTVFQDYALFPHMTVAQNVEYSAARAPRPRNDALHPNRRHRHSTCGHFRRQCAPAPFGRLRAWSRVTVDKRGGFQQETHNVVPLSTHRPAGGHSKRRNARPPTSDRRDSCGPPASRFTPVRCPRR